MNSFNEAYPANHAAFFAAEIEGLLNSKINSATRRTQLGDFVLPEMDTKNSKLYQDSILKIHNAFDDFSKLETPTERPKKIQAFNFTLNTQLVKPRPQKPRPIAEPILERRSAMDDETKAVMEAFNGEFDSDSETTHLFFHQGATDDVPVTFLRYDQERATPLISPVQIDFGRFLWRANDRLSQLKVYECDFCHQKFQKHAALGGHISKNHPKASKKFERRMKVYEMRKGERDKRLFLNKLEEKSNEA
jgi:hypothetical protein